MRSSRPTGRSNIRSSAIFINLAPIATVTYVVIVGAAGHGKTLDGRYYCIPQDLRYHTTSR